MSGAEECYCANVLEQLGTVLEWVIYESGCVSLLFTEEYHLPWSWIAAGYYVALACAGISRRSVERAFYALQV